jgi:hypothetical protein
MMKPPYEALAKVERDAILSHDQMDSLKLYARHDLHEARAAGRGDQAEAR